MDIDLRLPAPGPRELATLGGAAALAFLGIVEAPVALVLAAVPLVRAHLTPRSDGSQGTTHLHVGLSERSTGASRRGATAASSPASRARKSPSPRATTSSATGRKTAPSTAAGANRRGAPRRRTGTPTSSTAA